MERLIKRGLLLEHCCCGRPRRSKLHRRPRSRLCAAVRLRPSIHAPYLSALNLMTCVCSGLPAARLRRNLVAACSFTFACPHPVDCGRLSAVEAHGPCGPPNLLLHLPKDTLEDLGGRGMKVRRHIQRFPENWARSKGQTGLAPAARRLTAALRQLIHGAGRLAHRIALLLRCSCFTIPRSRRAHAPCAGGNRHPRPNRMPPWSGGTYDRWFLSSSTSTIFIMRMRILVAVGVGESSFSLKFLLLQCD